ncbi:hypothetical protein ACLH5N_002699, partial [Aeromonas salmonicida]
FIIYMHENKFFSYDFFVDGVFGLNTFVVVTAILFAFMSLYFYGFILLFKLGIKEQKEKGKNSLRFLTWLAIIISIMTHYVFFEHAMSANKPQLILWFMSISALLCAFFTLSLDMDLKEAFRTGYLLLFLLRHQSSSRFGIKI